MTSRRCDWGSEALVGSDLYSYVTVYKCLHGVAPPYLAVDCVPVTSLPSQRHLWSAESGCLAITGARTTLGSRNFAVAGAKIWNSLPVDLWLLSQSLRTFGHKLKHCLLMSHERIWGFFKFALCKFSHYYYYLFLTDSSEVNCLLFGMHIMWNGLDRVLLYSLTNYCQRQWRQCRWNSCTVLRSMSGWEFPLLWESHESGMDTM